MLNKLNMINESKRGYGSIMCYTMIIIRFYNWTKSLIAVNLNLLRPAIIYKTSFVSLKRTIKFLFITKNPHRRERFTSMGRDTNSHVLFLHRASYSSTMVAFQLWSFKALIGFHGMGEIEVVVEVFKLRVFSPNTPDKLRNSPYTLDVSEMHRIHLSFRKHALDTLFLTVVNPPLALFTILPSLNPNPNLT